MTIKFCYREKDELIEVINKLNSSVAQFREKEASASQKLKRSLDVIDQAQFEKNQVGHFVYIVINKCLYPRL